MDERNNMAFRSHENQTIENKLYGWFFQHKTLLNNKNKFTFFYQRILFR